MTRFMTHVGSLALVILSLPGCASEREQTGLRDWEGLRVSFRPCMEPAAITSASTLGDYVAVALQRNPALQAQAYRWRAGLERISQARSLPDPQVTYAVFLKEIETKIGPQVRRYGVSQRVPWPGKLISASDVALEESEADRARTERVRLEIAHRVTEAYTDYYYLARELEVFDQTLALLRHWESVAQARFRAGVKAAHRDVIKAQVEIGLVEDRVVTLREARRPKADRLRALLDMPGSADLPWPTTLPDRILREDDEHVRSLIRRHSPVLKELDSRVAARERGVDQAWQSYFPDLVLGFDYTEVGPAGVPVRSSGDDAALARVGLSLPIWFGRNQASVSEARARLRAAELERVDAGNSLEASVTRVLFDCREASRKQRLYRDSLVPKAEEALKTIAAAYESGSADFLSVLDAERVLLEFHLARERALADRVRSLSELEMRVGVELTSPREDSE